MPETLLRAPISGAFYPQSEPATEQTFLDWCHYFDEQGFYDDLLSEEPFDEVEVSEWELPQWERYIC